MSFLLLFESLVMVTLMGLTAASAAAHRSAMLATRGSGYGGSTTVLNGIMEVLGVKSQSVLCAGWSGMGVVDGGRRRRTMSAAAAAAAAATDEELALEEKLRAALGDGAAARVRDTSGGCGTMFRIEAIAPQFTGIATVKQHKLITDILKHEIKSWHGFTIKTQATEK